jgi:hypothetical protein
MQSQESAGIPILVSRETSGRSLGPWGARSPATAEVSIVIGKPIPRKSAQHLVALRLKRVGDQPVAGINVHEAPTGQIGLVACSLNVV